jgi:hypothetical protein
MDDRRTVGSSAMAVGSEQRRRELRHQVEGLFAHGEVERALDLLQLTDMAWHDCFEPKELEIPAEVLDDILLLAGGNLSKLIGLARMAVLDFRDVRVAADDVRRRAGSTVTQQ